MNYIYYYGAWYKIKPLDIGTTTRDSLNNFDFNIFNPNDNNFNPMKKLEKKIKYLYLMDS